MHARSFVSLAVLAAYCLGTSVTEAEKKLEIVCENMENDLLDLGNFLSTNFYNHLDEVEDFSQYSTFLTTTHILHNQTLDAKRYVMESLKFWSDENNLKTPGEAEKEKVRIEKFVAYIGVLNKFVFELLEMDQLVECYGKPDKIENLLKDIVQMIYRMEICRYRLQLIAEGREISDRGAYLCRECLDLNAFADVVGKFEYCIQLFLERALKSDSTDSDSD